jgi:hypothetical protein
MEKQAEIWYKVCVGLICLPMATEHKGSLAFQNK